MVGRGCDTSKKNSFYPVVWTFLLSVVFCLQSPICPLYSPNTRIWNDSSVFLYIGKVFWKNILFYRDLFDHKGPLLYLINAFGWLFGGKTGVWCLNVLAIWVFSLFCFKSLDLIIKNRNLSFYGLLIIFVAAIQFFLGGNLVETYAIPFIAISQFYFLRYLISQKLNFGDIIITGFCFGCILFLRPNMVGLWAACVLFLAVNLTVSGQYRKLIFSIGMFIAGTLICAIPILAYLYSTNNLSNMYKCYIVFNMEYSSHILPSDRIKSWGSVVNLLYSDTSIAIFVSGFYLYCFSQFRRFNRIQKQLIIFSLIFLFFSVASVMISGHTPPYYMLIVVPCLVVPFSLFLNSINTICQNVKLSKKAKPLPIV